MSNEVVRQPTRFFTVLGFSDNNILAAAITFPRANGISEDQCVQFAEVCRPLIRRWEVIDSDVVVQDRLEEPRAAAGEGLMSFGLRTGPSGALYSGSSSCSESMQQESD